MPSRTTNGIDNTTHKRKKEKTNIDNNNSVGTTISNIIIIFSTNRIPATPISNSQQQTPSYPNQQVTELQILQTTGAEPGKTADRTRRMPLDQLQRDPAL
ncbi:unnamed protein product [Macrosiphum euphorbiae]|uniref:Uncharacterized protein n=1 Tax=Macrosiphum euphorbiae TaxID=13131 RepID=A0AAV0Y4P2_9HEMI|nr:unnamed protein product [Macrosiphum euphorbiae]